MPEAFNLPASSFNELMKIIIGYSNSKGETSLDDLSRKIGMQKTTISANNKFLVEMGIIKGGNKKVITDLGSGLGRAFEFQNKKDIKKYIEELISNNEFISDIISRIRVQNGLSADEIVKQILYHSGKSETKGNKAGARCLLDIINSSGLIEEIDGKFIIVQGKSFETVETNEEYVEMENASMPETLSEKITSNQHSFSVPSIVINIQLQIPESEKPDVYDNLFKSLRKNLIDG